MPLLGYLGSVHPVSVDRSFISFEEKKTAFGRGLKLLD